MCVFGLTNGMHYSEVCTRIAMQVVGVADMGDEGHEEGQEQDEDKQ